MRYDSERRRFLGRGRAKKIIGDSEIEHRRTSKSSFEKGLVATPALQEAQAQFREAIEATIGSNQKLSRRIEVAYTEKNKKFKKPEDRALYLKEVDANRMKLAQIVADRIERTVGSVRKVLDEMYLVEVKPDFSFLDENAPKRVRYKNT